MKRSDRQSGAARETIAKLLRMIEREAERLSQERHMSHLPSETNNTLTVEMEYRPRNIQQRTTACILHEGQRIVPYKIHHDGWTQQPHFTKRHPADSTNL